MSLKSFVTIEFWLCTKYKKKQQLRELLLQALAAKKKLKYEFYILFNYRKENKFTMHQVLFWVTYILNSVRMVRLSSGFPT